jgi:ankyrin repeat protein
MERIKILIHNGADINSECPHTSFRAIHCAAQMGNVEAIRVAKELGADINAIAIINGGAYTPLMLANVGGHKEAEARLRKLGAK